MKLYTVQRVEQAEASKMLNGSRSRQPRRKAAEKSIATKKARIAEWVAQLKIEVPRLDKEHLIKAACEHYNRKNHDGGPASRHSNPDFLARICVNYLRHCLTSYEKHLAEIEGKVGVSKAYGHRRRCLWQSRQNTNGSLRHATSRYRA